MSRVHLCLGRTASAPYSFDKARVRVYSVEELCYFLKENAYLLDETIFTRGLSDWLYKECGLRACDIGSYMIGNDPDTGKQLKSLNEFTRMAIPRRVYTQAHYDLVIEAINEVWKNREAVKKGYRITWEPPILRHFQASLAPIE